jgi:hypothetical protein
MFQYTNLRRHLTFAIPLIMINITKQQGFYEKQLNVKTSMQRTRFREISGVFIEIHDLFMVKSSRLEGWPSG